ncbi:MAG: ABC transporter permease [Candidatus Eremiobacteraeota bacterium]|nr:ABC transporter permease [Candidatus Eremiobacteraeota bacterium]
MSGFGVLGTLLRKEFTQLFRNRQIIALLIVPPIVQLVVFGLALDPQVKYLRLGVVDESRTVASRDLVAAFTSAADAFTLSPAPASSSELAQQVRSGELALGVVIPPDFARTIDEGRTASVQVVADGVNSYVAGLASSYASQIVAAYGGLPAPIRVEPVFFYNPGQVSSWFFIPNILAALLLMVSILVAAVEGIREKETGTLEQLLMTPVSATEIVVAKMLPPFVSLLITYALAMTIALAGFRLPFRGDPIGATVLSAMTIFVGVSLGMMLSTFSATRRQVILSALFLVLPLMLLSGALSPLESMPAFFQKLALFNPLYHYALSMREIWLKGDGIDIYWPHALALLAFALLATTVSSVLYRRQLA